MGKPEFETIIKEYVLWVESVFVPFSFSRNKNELNKSLNWEVSLWRAWHRMPQYDGSFDPIIPKKLILTTDYSVGIAHCPSYNPFNRAQDLEKIKYETEKGFPEFRSTAAYKPILPDICDFLYSLIQNLDVLNYFSFEKWADDFGLNSDSKKAEKLYNGCLSIALKLKNGLPPEAIEKL